MRRRRAWGAAVLAAIGAGCGSGSVPEVRVADAVASTDYPARADWIVDQAPAVAAPSWWTPGYPPLKSLSLGADATPDPAQVKALSGEVGKSVLKPAAATAEDRKAVGDAVAKLFGTPLAPTVPPDLAAKPELKLDAPRLAAGAAVYRRLCLSCHGPAGGGDGPAATTLVPLPRDYRAGVFKFVRSAPEAGGKPGRDDLKRVLRRGVDGTAMPPFPGLTDDELDAVVSYVVHLSLRGEVEYQALKRLIKSAEDSEGADAEVKGALKRATDKWLVAETKPAPSPEPPAYATEDERSAAAFRGYALFTAKDGAGCLSCHVDYGRAPNLKYDVWGSVVQPRNLFLGQLRGGRSDADLYARLYTGVNGSGMPSHKQLVDAAKPGEPDKLWDLVAFVRAVGTPEGRAALRAKGAAVD